MDRVNRYTHFGLVRECAFVLATMLGLGCAGHRTTQDAGVTTTMKSNAPKNIIVLFADGTAPTQWEFGRYSSQRLRKRPFYTTDTIFHHGVLGMMSTYSGDAIVTDSAAAGSALSTGEKTNNGMVAVAPNGTPHSTIMEVAKAEGKQIGLVTTTAIYDASPAAFSVHALHRNHVQSIVDQYLTLEPRVLIGAGAEYFLPNGVPGGKRTDDRDLLRAFAAKGYQVVRSARALGEAKGERLLALFPEDDEIAESADRVSVAERAAAALRILSASSPHGFVLFVENENTDIAGHSNDIAQLMHALWDFDDAVKVALDFQSRNPNTLILVTGDHETGGLSVTSSHRGSSSNDFVYPGDADLKMINGITMSLNKVANELGDKPSPDALDRILAQHFPGFSLDPDLRRNVLEQAPIERNFGNVTQNVLGRMIARQTGFYWGTGGHTTEPVAVGAFGPGADSFRGYQDNTDFGRRLQRLIANH